MRSVLKCGLLALGFVAKALAEGDYHGEVVAKNPNEGDTTFQDTQYKLELYSQKHFHGRAVEMMPLECTPIQNHFCHKVKSIKFEGNNCCFFFPTTSCSNLQAGQRIVGDVANVDNWGFPEIGAVKCLSHSACQVMRYDSDCTFDPSCAKAKSQGSCPFDRGCKAYSPVQARDWQKFHVDNWSPVVDRFYVDCNGEVHGRNVSSTYVAPDGATARLVGSKVGGEDDYDMPLIPQRGSKGKHDGEPSKKQKQKQQSSIKKAYEKDEKESREQQKHEGGGHKGGKKSSSSSASSSSSKGKSKSKSHETKKSSSKSHDSKKSGDGKKKGGFREGCKRLGRLVTGKKSD